ncbi:antirestriction protein [Sphingobium sp. Leaf26]|uniref:antirestriction protein ArdA n=1 Tax=Sphingobium sp. Leaf26 TaxID=1735693 RepID=UPI0006FD475A|nr:antirestriction protein ArdA [Sphingobium sp. Leaf26]KQN01038.1 antirestriction protein [Sphingobium sp. Leaf26]
MGEQQTHKLEPRIYFACLAAYNNGHLHGEWIDADQDPWQIYDDVKKMLAASPVSDAEEWAIHDYEGFEGIRIEECDGFERVAELATFVIEYGKLGAEVFSYFGSLAEARSALSDQYAGQYESLADFAQEITEESANIPDTLRYYLDYERMARDMAISDVIAFETGMSEIHVFWSR